MRSYEALVKELKLALREGGIRYADVARALGLSEASVKRLFASGKFTLDRLEQVCALAGMDTADLVERLAQRGSRITQLTDEQEQSLMADPRLFLMTYLIFNGWSAADISRVYDFGPADVDALIDRLADIGIVRRRPGGRVRYLLTRNFTWRKDGPMQRFVERVILPEFFHSRFDEPEAEFRFFAAALSPASAAQLRRSIMRLVHEFNELAEHDAALPMHERQGVAGVLAMRPMHFSGFSRYRRGPAAGR